MTVSAVALAGGCAENNPLSVESTAPYGAPRFDEIRNEHYKPAFEQAVREAREEVDAIVANPEAPTFANTIEALEFSGKRLDAISNIFFNLNEAHTNDTMQSLALELSPMLTAFGNDISLNPQLFERVKAVYDRRDSLGLNTEQARLLEKTYKSFARNGAALSEEDKQIYRELTEKLSELSLKFNQNSLAATNAFTLHITDSAKVAELPAYVREGMAAEAKERDMEGWVVTLQAPSMIPFMTFSSDRELKEKVWRAYNGRSLGGEFDNAEIVKEIADNRLKLANLLGYATYADYVLEERMAENAPTVNLFLAELLDRALDAAKDDVESIAEYAKTQGFRGELMPWDFGYYSEKLKNEKYSINEEQMKPYFKLENVQKGVFLLAEKLYGVTFKENTDIPVYHPDVKAYEVYDADGRFLAVLYMDFFPRASKRGGAWMTEFRSQSVENGEEIRPLISVVTNFTKPTENTPSLLTFDEVTTLLHEFGHALHGIFADGTYPSLTGTSVYRDFVELPSQIMENWATEKDFLDLWAVHYQTGEPMPAELIQKIIDAKNYLAAYGHVRQVAYGLNDMAWHSIAEPVAGSVTDFEKQATAKAQIMPYVDGQCTATSFGHIFSGGYAAGYYSYKWAEVLEADAFSLFKEKGIFDREVAGSFRENILSKGGTEHPMELYVRFRGHKPDNEALFEKMGIGKK
ncbi:M3 family metallopeptidase [uncultured Alistipes sp.]|uniref:M3 family metallopeptidase n=1 Tax=uncultured Alistipes sp. TaxID=538949 RepID=UPI00260C0904|nr:M3 family metallopeptidase [uncultured Alistipes sp.]